jgi:hypothetical protein
VAEKLAVVGVEAGADEQGGDPVDSSSMAGGGVVHGDARSKGGSERSVRRRGGDGSVRKCGGYRQGRGARDAGG